MMKRSSFTQKFLNQDRWRNAGLEPDVIIYETAGLGSFILIRQPKHLPIKNDPSTKIKYTSGSVG